jgi:zinc transport system substrate-binding protein
MADIAAEHQDWGSLRLLLLGVTAVALLTCSETKATANDLAVVATIKPIHALVAQVMGETGEPKLLVTGAASPHTYSLKPSDAKALNDAQLIFRVSEEIEPFTRKIVASLPQTATVVTLANSPGLKILDQRTGNTFEAHVHEDGHGHSDGDEDQDEHHRSEAGPVRDGHVWLDPQNGVAMLHEIARSLSKAAPEKAAIYEANAAAAIAGLEKIAKEIDSDLASVKSQPFVVFHDAYQYFEARFGVPAAGAITVSPDVQPSAKRLGEIRDKIRNLNVRCVFAEPQFKSKLVATVIEGTGAKAGMLDPEGASVEPGPAAYETLLKKLAQDLKDCLSG